MTAATSSDTMGCISAGGNRTVCPLVADWAMLPTNSKNCVARTIVYGTGEALIRFSWAIFARKQPLASRRSVPTTDACGCFRGEEIATRRFEKLQDCLVLPRGCIRDIDNDLCADERRSKPLAGD